MNECPECGSHKIVRDALMREIGRNDFDQTIRVVYYEKPDSWISKQPVYSTVRAEVCGDCGYLQPYAEDFKRLWFAYLAANSDVE